VALGAGACLPLAFAPLSLFPIAIFSLSILLWSWQNVTAKRGMWRGFLFGLGSFGVGISWVYVSLSQFGNLPIVGAVLLTAGLIGLMSLYPALLAGLWIHLFPEKSRVTLIFVIPATWVLFEWLRGWLFTGFPWLSLGYSQIASPLGNFAPIFGVYGVSGLVVLSAALLLIIWQWRRGWILGMFGIAIWIGGWALSHWQWTYPLDEPVQVALIQGNIPQDFKWLPSYQVPTMERYFELSQRHYEQAELIIWPETAIPLFYHQSIPHLVKLFQQHGQHEVDFIVGIPIMNREEQYFNGVFGIGEQPEFYYKRHLVPFGEYVPFAQQFEELLHYLAVPMSNFSSGPDHQSPFHSAGQVIGVSICYEDVFGELIRRSLPEVTLLVNVSNDAWFGHSIAPHQHLEIAQMRALEMGRYLLRATNTGISAVIDVRGKVVARSPQFEVASLEATAQPYQGSTPYVWFGDQLVLTLSLMSLGMGGLIRGYRRKLLS